MEYNNFISDKTVNFSEYQVWIFSWNLVMFVTNRWQLRYVDHINMVAILGGILWVVVSDDSA